MKKGFSFELTLITLLVFSFSYWYFLVKIFNIYEPPNFVVTALILIFFVAVFEILTRMRPGPFESVSNDFKSLSTKDRAVLLFSFGMPIIINSFFGDYIKSLPIVMKLICVGIVMLSGVAPIMLFGSKDLRKKTFRNQKD